MAFSVRAPFVRGCKFSEGVMRQPTTVDLDCPLFLYRQQHTIERKVSRNRKYSHFTGSANQDIYLSPNSFVENKTHTAISRRGKVEAVFSRLQNICSLVRAGASKYVVGVRTGEIFFISWIFSFLRPFHVSRATLKRFRIARIIPRDILRAFLLPEVAGMVLKLSLMDAG